jgi:small-conductance mechanosensitive channel
MFLAELDWGVILQRAGYTLALWVGLWLFNRLIIRRLPTLFERFDTIDFDDREIHVLRRIGEVLVLLIGLMITLSIFDLVPWLLIGDVGARLIALALLWFFVWILVRYLSIWIAAFDEQIDSIELDPRDIATLERLLAIAILLVAIVVTLAILGLTSLLYSALTAAGVFGIVVGFAVKDIAANFISGIFILIDRPFVIGDAIKVKDISGTVTNISLRSTQLVTFDGPAVTIPNSMVATEPTTNYTVSQYRRALFIVSVLSSVDLNRAIRVIRDTLDSEPRLLSDRPPAIYVDQIRDYVVDLQVIAYTSNEHFLETQSDLKKAITTAFIAHGVDLAVPVQVHFSETPADESTTGHWPLSGDTPEEISDLRP